MREDQHSFMTLLGQLPARLTAEQTAWVLNCQLHDLPVLMAARLLKPLGNPPQNGIKFFATVEINELSRDRAWLAKATNAVNQYWRTQNLRRKDRDGRKPAASPALQSAPSESESISASI